jgi:predicted alpha/beta superfamily hydrolase
MDFPPLSAIEIKDLEPQLEDKGSINHQVITLNIVSEQPDEDRNTQQQMIIQQKMTSSGHWNSDGAKVLLTSKESK